MEGLVWIDSNTLGLSRGEIMVGNTKYSSGQHAEYLKMLSVIGTKWSHAMLEKPEYANSAGWNLLTNLWNRDKVKMSDAYTFLKELRSPTTQRKFILEAIRSEFVECSDRELTDELRGVRRGRRTTTNVSVSRRGAASPEIWLSARVRRSLDLLFDEAIEELIKVASTISAQASNENTNSRAT
jgi:hypothetical protein